MKLFLSLTALLLSSQIALADATMVFVIPAGPIQDRQVNYKLQGHLLRIDQADIPHYKLYDQKQQTLLQVDGKTGNIARFDEQYINSRVELLNHKRQQKLAEVESKLKDKLKSGSAEEKRIAEELINQLKYPEFYGAHTYLKLQKTDQTRRINNIPCQIYQLNRNEQTLKQLCMASQKDLKLSDQEYATLRGFYHFNYSLQSRIRVAAGKTDFIQVDYEQQNIAGIPIEVMEVSDKDSKPELFLHSIQYKSLDTAQFDSKVR